jgi:hypothetical protein
MSGPAYGYAAEFGDAEALLQAARQARAVGYTRCEGYAPYAVPGLGEALQLGQDRVPLLMLLGGLLGGGGTYLLEWYTAVIAYPINVGGRPAASWPAFVPPAAEMTLLGAALLGFIALLAGGGLPRLRHPVFETQASARLSRDRFLLLIRSDDPRFDREGTAAFLQALQPLSLEAVE